MLRVPAAGTADSGVAASAAFRAVRTIQPPRAAALENDAALPCCPFMGMLRFSRHDSDEPQVLLWGERDARAAQPLAGDLIARIKCECGFVMFRGQRRLPQLFVKSPQP